MNDIPHDFTGLMGNFRKEIRKIIRPQPRTMAGHMLTFNQSTMLFLHSQNLSFSFRLPDPFQRVRFWPLLSAAHIWVKVHNILIIVFFAWWSLSFKNQSILYSTTSSPPERFLISEYLTASAGGVLSRKTEFLCDRDRIGPKIALVYHIRRA